MKVGVLQTGLVPEGFADRHGEYDVAFRRLLHLVDPEIEVIGWSVVEGEIPASPAEADGWIISGSKHGVYEDHPWIEPLKAFIRDCVEVRSPLIGVCFGHQVMAEALGGEARKWDGGWRLGPQEYDLIDPPGWMATAPRRFRIHAIHQDQVTTPPPDATRLATGEDCENAALIYGPAEAPYAISMQAHPEFTDDYARELIEHRRGAPFPEAGSDEALAKVGAEMHNYWASEWFIEFLKR